MSELVAVARAWARAWSEKRIDDYLGFYASSFSPSEGMGRDEWQAQRRERLAGPRTIAVELRGVEAEPVSSERARVSFDQAYRSDTFSDEVRKTLELVREDGRWRILEERVE